jgi:flavin reductase (DIM6/NTAB) family NADH-FMN oxidoreductase RutF
VELDPATLSQPDRYKLLIGSVVPRPIAFVSTCSVDGRTNLAPYSFFNGVGSDPLMLLFCPANKADGTEKDSLRNAKPVAEGGTGEFVVNVATEAYFDRMVATAEPLPPDESEFDFVGLTPAPGTRVKAPRVLESPVSFECRTWQVIRTNPGARAGGNIVLGEVVWIHIRDDLVNQRFHVDPAGLAAVGRMGGIAYALTRDRVELPAGRAALGQNVIPARR